MAEKGYNNSSIADIVSRAKVYKSLLHYYFKDKEKGLGEQSACFLLKYNDSTWKEALSASKSTDELLEGAVSFFKRGMEQNPDFFGLIFETWCTVRRSKRIKKNSILKLARERLTLRKS